MGRIVHNGLHPIRGIAKARQRLSVLLIRILGLLHKYGLKILRIPGQNLVISQKLLPAKSPGVCQTGSAVTGLPSGEVQHTVDGSGRLTGAIQRIEQAKPKDQDHKHTQGEQQPLSAKQTLPERIYLSHSYTRALCPALLATALRSLYQMCGHK
ncbi:hypothetical protein SDC9_157407 [bioreactor metagenome]|uniref:Uncharacterized protein n=1 Tax=bioreactor metagenome TaxID=1076179 RepID=A0A645FC23_9ZZZZ